MPVSSVASTITATQLAAVDTSRGGFIIANTDANDLYVLLDSGTPSATLYSFKIATGEAVEVKSYKGEVRGVWAADGTGAAIVTTWGQ